MTNDGLLGGLPVRSWYGRVVRIDRRSDSSSQTPWSMVKLISVDGKRCVIKPGGGHGKTETRRLSDLRPCWGENADLKKDAELVKGMAVSAMSKQVFEAMITREREIKEEEEMPKKKGKMTPKHKAAMMKGRDEAMQRRRDDTTPFYIIDCKFKRVLAFTLTAAGEITAQRILEWTQDYDRVRKYEGVSAGKRAHKALLKNEDKMTGLEDDDVLRVSKHEWKKVQERWEDNPKPDVASEEKIAPVNGSGVKVKRQYRKSKTLLDIDLGIDMDDMAERLMKFGEMKKRREQLKVELEELEEAMVPVAQWLSRFRK